MKVAKMKFKRYWAIRSGAHFTVDKRYLVILYFVRLNVYSVWFLGKISIWIGPEEHASVTLIWLQPITDSFTELE